MQEPLLQIFKQIGEALRAHGSMDTLMLSLLEMLRLCCRIFFSLNWQDLPEFFEDHMSEWMDEFNRSPPRAPCMYVLCILNFQRVTPSTLLFIEDTSVLALTWTQ